jgi:hypothetical protein
MQASRRAEVALAQISTRDLDLAIVGQLPTTHLPLGDQFEPGPMQIVGFEVTLRRQGLVEQDLEDASRNPNDPRVGPKRSPANSINSASSQPTSNSSLSRTRTRI